MCVAKYTLRDLRVINEALDQHAIVSIADASGNIVYANDKFCQISKYSRDELIGQNHRLLKSGLHDAEFFDEMWLTISSGRTWQGEICNLNKDGGLYWVETTIVPGLDENGLPYQYVSIRTEITQIKQAEADLAKNKAELEVRVEERTAELQLAMEVMLESKQRFRQLSENIQEAFWMTDPAKEKMLYISPAYEVIWGRSVQSLYDSPQSWLEAIHEEDRHRVLLAAMTMQADGLYDEEYRIFRPNGDIRWIHDKAFPVRDSGGVVYRVVGVAEDITERKLVEHELQKIQSNFATAQKIAGMGSWEWNVQDNTAYWSDEAFRIFGMDKSELREHRENFLDKIIAEDRNKVDQALSDALNGVKEYDIEYRVHHADGTATVIHAMAEVIRDKKGKPIMMHGTVQDITERIHLERQLRESENKFRVLFESANDSLILLSMDSRIVDINQRGHERLGYAKEEMLNHFIAEFVSPEYADRIPERVTSVMRDGHAIFESVHLRKDGSRMPVEINAKIVELDGEMRRYSIVRDITERKASEEEIKNLAFYDTLTHLPNRRFLMDRLNQALAFCGRNSRQGALLIIDLDHFKILNDSIGHDIGDMLLQQVSQRLESCIREGDTVARLGGDEFVVVLENLSEQPHEAAMQTETVGEKILAAFNQPYLLASHEYHGTASIGSTLFSGQQSSIEELMKQADIAMYQAKKAGRNALRFFDQQMQDIVTARVDLEGELRKALEKQQLHLYYQIQVDNSRRPLGAEALIRWIHPERGLVSPAQFIPLSEETGLIIPIGKWVLETACAQIKAWQKDALTRELVVAVNVSAKQFYQADFVAQVQAAIQHHAINPKLLKLELTEGMLLEDIEDTISTMSALNEVGVQFSLDDFGTGYSSLQYLKRLPLDQLKIDQSFVRDIATDSGDKAVVSAIIAMAHSLDMNVIAEGVETDKQRQFLLNMGCAHYQGYLFGRPVPIEQFEALLKQDLSVSY